MIIEPPGSNQFSFDVSQFEIIGYHGTSSAFCTDIEANGFIPQKVLSPSEHDVILETAEELEIDTDSYKQWLGMRSITFAKDAIDAISHVTSGQSGIQGAKNVLDALTAIRELGDKQQIDTIGGFREKIEELRNTNPVVYAVDLTGLGDRLTEDARRPYFQIYEEYGADVPKTGFIDPSRLIARLDL